MPPDVVGIDQQGKSRARREVASSGIGNSLITTSQSTASDERCAHGTFRLPEVTNPASPTRQTPVTGNTIQFSMSQPQAL